MPKEHYTEEEVRGKEIKLKLLSNPSNDPYKDWNFVERRFAGFNPYDWIWDNDNELFEKNHGFWTLVDSFTHEFGINEQRYFLDINVDRVFCYHVDVPKKYMDNMFYKEDGDNVELDQPILRSFMVQEIYNRAKSLLNHKLYHGVLSFMLENPEEYSNVNFGPMQFIVLEKGNKFRVEGELPLLEFLNDT